MKLPESFLPMKMAFAKSSQHSIRLKRLGVKDEIKGVAVFLASPAANYITGHTLVVDGGVVA
jgi:gluconate 5-dehydrogenase